jgi:hypothetical protein
MIASSLHGNALGMGVRQTGVSVRRSEHEKYIATDSQPIVPAKDLLATRRKRVNVSLSSVSSNLFGKWWNQMPRDGHRTQHRQLHRHCAARVTVRMG